MGKCGVADASPHICDASHDNGAEPFRRWRQGNRI